LAEIEGAYFSDWQLVMDDPQRITRGIAFLGVQACGFADEAECGGFLCDGMAGSEGDDVAPMFRFLCEGAKGLEVAGVRATRE
jgi:hypothetical protein